MLSNFAEEYPNYYKVYVHLGIEEELFEERLAWFEKALSYDQKYSVAHDMIGQTWIQKDKVQARQVIERSLEMFPDDSLIMQSMGNL